PPVDGCSNSNKVLYRNIVSRNIKCATIDTNTDVISGNQGSKFSLEKALKFMGNYLQLYKIWSCDVVYFTPGQTFYGILKYGPFIVSCLLFKKPYTIHLHGNFLGNQYKLLSRKKRKIFHFLVSKASAGIVITNSLRKNFEGILDGEKINVVEYFVENPLYEKSFAKTNNRLKILYLSNLMREKGILEFLDALILLNEDGVIFEANVAGSIETGLKGEVDTRLNRLGDKVKYLGTILGEEKTQKLIEANVFVLPTYYTMEGLPFSLLEAMATGNILVTTNHAGIPDVVNELNGFLVEKRSAEMIKNALKVISSDLVYYINKISGHNTSYARLNFTEENFTSSVIAVLQSTIK
ncbi:MAG TPA: glycosyltransferase family 4 protein, partial [Bacteroidia bacterium]|nr:glycosyltransferase family 4 protein [Bacteroidia bacterium]